MKICGVADQATPDCGLEGEILADGSVKCVGRDGVQVFLKRKLKIPGVLYKTPGMT